MSRTFGGAILFVVVALLLRSVPYPYWHWKSGHFSNLLDWIRGGHVEEYTLNVTNCPGLFIPSSLFLKVEIATEFPLP